MSEYETRLDIADYIIVQDTDDYGFSQDSVILANLANIGKNDVVLDIGCGTGILSTLAIVKKGVKSAVGIDVQKHACDLARKSVQINGLQDKLQIIDGDVRDIKNLVKAESFDAVLCNPPYFRSGASENAKGVSRTESGADIADFVKGAAWALRFGGDLYIVYKADRLLSLFTALANCNLAPKEMTVVFPKLSKGVDVVIVKARKGAKEGLKIKSLVVKDEDGKDTIEFKELYD